MEEEEKIPRLLEFLFGEGAERAQRGASRRLMGWSEAFEGWLGERKASARKQAVLTWRRLLQERGKMPWEMGQEDIEAHLAWMEAQGLAATTRANAVGIVGSFYRWCEGRGVDPECPKGFNPAAGAQRPRIERYAGARVLSRGEVEALLGILRRDATPLGKRDHAFFLMRLRMGAPLKSLLGLRWGQIEVEEREGYHREHRVHGEEGGRNEEGGEKESNHREHRVHREEGEKKGGEEEKVWVRWREGGERVEMPGEVWEAIKEWLRASGRLEKADPAFSSATAERSACTVHSVQREERFVFAPVVNLMREGDTGQAGAWAEGRAVSNDAILGSLKVYGRRAGIEEEKLTLLALRRTATRMRLEEGESVEGMQRFLDSREEAKFTKSRLGRLARLPAEERAGVEKEAAPPERKPRPFQAGEGMTHGLYAHSQPAEEVLAMLKEDVQGIEDELAGLRMLERGLMEMQGRARSSKEAVRLMEAYTLTAKRLGDMIEAEKQWGRSHSEEDDFVERGLAALDRIGEATGMEGMREWAIKEALSSEDELTIGTRRVAEEIAGTRVVLRRTLKRAREAEEMGKTDEYLHLTEIYSSGCNRLMRLLRTGKAERGKIAAYIRKVFDEILRGLQEEWEEAWTG